MAVSRSGGNDAVNLDVRASLTVAGTSAGTVAFDATLGIARHLLFSDGERRLTPLHTAPWVGALGAEALPDLPPVERGLAGDFFCAAFGVNDVEPAPPHGWSANSRWQVTETGPGKIAARLERRVMGAVIEKTLTLSDEAPLLVQEHKIIGGDGALTVAHHPMVHLKAGGRLCVSNKSAALSSDVPLEAGRNRLQCPARVTDLCAFPGADGTPVDLTDLPIGTAHEDFVTLVEASDSPMGWTAILRHAEDDIVFFLKDPSVLPVTMLWHSNGGRDYAPWDGCHTGVVGVEDGCAAGAAGHAAALGPNPVSSQGVPTALPLEANRTHRIVHVIGAIARPKDWTRVTDIRATSDSLVLSGDAGPARSLPFENPFLNKEP
jgi:hypothetical protein